MEQQRVCANCGAGLQGAFCAACGQKGEIHRSLAYLAEELLHGLLHFDGKFWRTLPELALRPGDLTKAYWEGRRVSVISPLALFLFSVFLFFLATATAGSPASMTVVDGRPAAGAPDPAKAPPPSAQNPEWAQALKDGQAKGELTVQTGWPWLDAQLMAKAKDPELAFFKIKSAASKYSFLLVPLSLPFLWLLFATRRDLAMFDHAVFILYSLSFMLLLGSVLTLAGQLLPVLAGAPIALASFAAPAHLFRHLKQAYGLSFLGTFWRTGLLLFFCLIVLMIYVFLIMILGLLG